MDTCLEKQDDGFYAFFKALVIDKGKIWIGYLTVESWRLMQYFCIHEWDTSYFQENLGFENDATDLVPAWFCYELTNVHTMPLWNKFCWPHLPLLTNNDTILFQPCSTVKSASVSYRHETLPALSVHTTTGSVPFSFHTDKRSVFIPYHFQAIFNAGIV